MAGETTITVIGNLTDDPELRFTPSGAAVAKFRVASTPRFMDQAVRRVEGRRAALPRVQRLAAGGGERRRVAAARRPRDRRPAGCVSGRTRPARARSAPSYELEVDEIGPSLRYATAKVQKMSRSGGGGGGGFGSGGGGGGGSGGGGGNFDDPWATAAPARRGPVRVAATSTTSHRSNASTRS